jgi:hypothetical protein
MASWHTAARAAGVAAARVAAEVVVEHDLAWGGRKVHQSLGLSARKTIGPISGLYL